MALQAGTAGALLLAPKPVDHPNTHMLSTQRPGQRQAGRGSLRGGACGGEQSTRARGGEEPQLRRRTFKQAWSSTQSGSTAPKRGPEPRSPGRWPHYLWLG